MNTQTISIDIPSDVFLALNKSENELKKEMLLSMAVKLYQSEKLTMGKASQFAGMSRLEFEKYLSENDIPISLLSEEEIFSDVEKLRTR